MYLLTQLWTFLAAALALGGVFGFAVKRVLVHRKLRAVQHGAWTEQQAHRALMAELGDEHRRALEVQATELQASMAAAEAARLEVISADHEVTLAQLQQRARDDLAALVRAHDDVQAEAREALVRLRAELVAETATRQAQEGELARLRDELDRLRERLADTLAQHEQGLAEILLQSQADLREQLDAQSRAHERALAAEQDALARAQRERDDETRQLAEQATQLREQLDVMLIELSAAARARDAREAQRAQLAEQLALEAAARRREAEISQAQRTQLRERVMHLSQQAQGQQVALQAQCDALHEQLLASRRTTRAAVLAARQRERLLETELGRLREQLGEPGGATVHELTRAA
jgi:hypothetical protein